MNLSPVPVTEYERRRHERERDEPKLTDIHATLVACLDHFERLATGSMFYLTTPECKTRVALLEDTLADVADELTVLHMREREFRETEAPLIRHVARVKGNFPGGNLQPNTTGPYARKRQARAIFEGRSR
jgi:hypothetical protein